MDIQKYKQLYIFFLKKNVEEKKKKKPPCLSTEGENIFTLSAAFNYK